MDEPEQEASQTLQASFEPYGRLLKMLMPSVAAVIVHDGQGRFVWASNEWSVTQVESLVNDAIVSARRDPDEYAGVSREFDADFCAYSITMRGEPTELLGVVSLVARLVGSQSSARPIGYVRQLVQPALECLKRELELRASLDSRERDLGTRERDLSLMMEMSSQKNVGNSDADELTSTLKTGIEHLGAALAAIWVPEKGLSISMTRTGKPMSIEVLERMEKHLMAWMLLQQRTIVVNRTAKVASDTAAPYKILACPVRHPSERVMGVLVMFNPPSAADFDTHQTRIAELLAKKATVIIQAQYDASTGLMTRHAFERQATALFASCAPTASHAILYLDIDRLHVINETFGMHIGDEVIVEVAESMAHELPAGALSSRISGDRLAALLPNTNLEMASKVAESLRAAAAAIIPNRVSRTFEVSVSIGVSPIIGSKNPLAHALATAEIACKAAKDRGRNRVEVFQDSDQSIIRRHTDIMVVGSVRDALDNDKFRLDAQPILPLRGSYGRPRFELLLRMIGDKGEVIPPGKFLSSAERYQLMPAIDRWVVRHACELLGQHNAALGSDAVKFAVNLSGQSLQDPEFLGFVIDQIKTSNVPPSLMCFELTETATIGNLEKAQEFMTSLQDLGCQFALDDFGTGVSSLAYLKALSVSYLKIDGSFVRDALTNPRSESMIKAIAQLAKVMRMETIAEYVETDELRIRMADLGVDYGQGYAVGRPRPLRELLHELAVFEATVSTWAGLETSDPPPVAAESCSEAAEEFARLAG
jgi:diguanylate cyclase (GGDEF)-like protein